MIGLLMIGFVESLSKSLDKWFGDSLGEKPKYATRTLQSVAASEF
jgi:hypothetical protein